MSVATSGIRLRRGFAMAVAALLLTLGLTRTASADDAPMVMKITTPTLNDAPHEFSKRFAAAVEKDTGGRIKGQVFPASQLGSIPRQIEGTQFGSIQVAVIPPDFYVGVDERFEVMAAPGLVDTMQQGARVLSDPEVQKLMLGLGADKGLHGAAMFIAAQSSIISRTPLRHLEDFKGKKIRVFASDFQKVPMERLGATPVAMSLGDVLPAIQQGAIDGAVAAVPVFHNFHYQDVTKYVTMTNQPAIFIMVEFNKKWFDGLPSDLHKIVSDDATSIAKEIIPWAIQYNDSENAAWTKAGGELITFPPAENAKYLDLLASVGADVSKTKPALESAYQIVTAAAARAKATQ